MKSGHGARLEVTILPLSPRKDLLMTVPLVLPLQIDSCMLATDRAEDYDHLF